MPVLAEFKNTVFALSLILAGCGSSPGQVGTHSAPGAPGYEATRQPEAQQPDGGSQSGVVVAANRTAAYFPLLRGRRLALVANQTSVVFRGDGEAVHLADTLLASGMEVVRVFAPEHGFRGQADAGQHVQDGTDRKTGLPIVSLYGANRKPQPAQLGDLDLVVFDIQDLGVRFYTYIATLQLVMEACAGAGIPVLVLDRPNPNADFVDGPVMEPEHMGFLGMTPIPLAYGMTLGEYAALINEEGWLEGGRKADLTVVPLEGYRRSVPYDLPIAPSPNIPNTQAAMLYPSLGLFEGTTVNAGRGTDHQFQSFGAPNLSPDHFKFRYTPRPNPGARHPKHEGVECNGMDLREVTPPRAVDLSWLIEAYAYREPGSEFFLTSGFTRHAGTTLLQKQIESGMDAAEIRASWRPGIENFKTLRAKYLRYP